MPRRFKIVDLGGDEGRAIEVVQPGFAPVQSQRLSPGGEAEFTLQDSDKIEIRTVEAHQVEPPAPETADEPKAETQEQAAS